MGITHRLGPRACLALAVVILLAGTAIRHQFAQMDPVFFPSSWPGLKGLAYYGVGAYGPAGRAYREHVQLTIRGAAVETPGVVALDRRDFEGARKIAERALARAPDDAGLLLLSAVAHARLRDAGGAIDRINRVLRTNRIGPITAFPAMLELAGDLAGLPPDARPYALLAELYRYLRVFDPANGRRAVAAAREAITRGDHPADAYVVIGVVAEKEHRFQDALEAFRRATAVDPTYAEGYRRQGIIYAWQGDLGMQYQTSKTAFELVPNDPLYIHDLELVVLDRLRDAPAAVALMQRAVQADPTSTPAQRALGLAYGLLGRYDEAATRYRESIRLAPNDIKGWEGLAWVFTLRGSVDEAIAAHEETLRRAPRDYNAYARLGSLFAKLKRPKDAAQAYGRALQLGDRELATHLYYCVETYNSGDFERSTPCFERVLAREPGEPTARRYLYWSERNQGLKRAAR